MKSKILVGIVMGSDTDLAIMAEAAAELDKLGIGHEVRVLSAHRTPVESAEYAERARGRGIEVIICGAGGAAHLGGALAAQTTIPVLCVPMPTTSLAGVDSLYSIVQMPAGVPVATLAVGKPGARNAGILAAQILSLKYPGIRKRLDADRIRMRDEVITKDARLRKLGVAQYLKEKGGKV